MDLDKLKEVWRETEIKPSIDDDKIYRMLDNKGKSALSGLLRFERLSLCLLPFVAFLPFLHNHIFKAAAYPLFSICWYMAFCIVGFFWQIYKLNLLGKIDPNKMDVLFYSKQITIYRKYIQYEFFAGVCWMMVFFFSYVFSLLLRFSFSGTDLTIIIVFSVLVFIVSVVFVTLFYKWMYVKKIREIERSIKEIEEFEKDNI